MTLLVSGGAGYIGAHVVHALLDSGFEAVVIDDLSTGSMARIPDGVPFVRADVRDTPRVRTAFARYRPTAVIHLAGLKDVAESVARPLRYYRDNLDGLRSVLSAVVDQGIGAVLFSSSAAVYGTPDRCPVTEADQTRPQNTYGRTKLVGEWMLRDAALAGGFAWTALRYFNVAGALRPDLREIGGSNLVPSLLRAAELGRAAQVYGSDYGTPDGSAVRDYVHVGDIAEAHVCAALAMADGAVSGEVFNVGRGEGASVLQMVAAVGRALGRDLPHETAPRRPGDPSEVVACADRIRERLGWRARYDLDEIVRSSVDVAVPTRA